MGENLQWDADSAAYIRARGDRYPGGTGVEPDPKSRMGASRFIGWSPLAGRVLVVIAYRDVDGDLHGINAWPASGVDLRIYEGGPDDGEHD